MERATIVYNPAARNAPSAGRLRVAALGLRVAGWEIDLRATEGAGHATELARAAVTAGSSVVFACGGDGTVNEVVNGLVGSDGALGVVRGGMGNVFAKEIGVPRAPEQALRVLVEGERRRFDVGLASSNKQQATGTPGTGNKEPGTGGEQTVGEGRYFLLMAGVGFDASVVRRVPDGPKRLLGSAAYGVWGALELARYRPRRALVAFDGGEEQEVDLYWLLLGNTRSYGGVIDITSEAVVDDGLLDAYVFAGDGLAWLVSTGLRVVSRRQEGARGVSFRKVREAAVATPGLAVQADGEYFGETPIRFEVVPGALSVLLPMGRGRQLFRGRV